jgi:hypothetical protein
MGRINIPVGLHQPAANDAKMNADSLIAIYVASLLLTLGFLVLYSELRRKRFEPEPSEDHIFRCGKCAYVYTDDPDVDRSRCPQCGCMNEVITF